MGRGQTNQCRCKGEINGNCKYLRRFERVVPWEYNFQEEHPLLVRAIFWTHDCGLPFEEIILVDGSSRAVLWRITSEVLKFFFDTLERHGFSTEQMQRHIDNNNNVHKNCYRHTNLARRTASAYKIHRKTMQTNKRDTKQKTNKRPPWPPKIEQTPQKNKNR